MRKLLLILPFLLVGCASKTAEEQEAAKYDAPKMMSDAEAQKMMAADPRKGGARPTPR